MTASKSTNLESLCPPGKEKHLYVVAAPVSVVALAVAVLLLVISFPILEMGRQSAQRATDREEGLDCARKKSRNI